MRSKIFLTIIALFLLNPSGIFAGTADRPSEGFKFRQALHINGSPPLFLSQYQVRVRLGETTESPGAHLCLGRHARADFSDVRFFLEDGKTPVPFYLERVTGEPGLRVAHFFVKVPNILPQGVTLYVYYGNADAVSGSSPEETFDFYDDFKHFTPGGGKWRLHKAPGGSWSVSDEGLKLDAASIVSKDFKFKGGVIEFSATAETGYEVQAIIRDPDLDSDADITQIVYASAHAGAEHAIAVGNIVRVNARHRIAAVTRYDYRVVVIGPDIVFERYTPGFSIKQAGAVHRDMEGPREGFLGLKTSGPGLGRNLTTYHWIRARKYVSREPFPETRPDAVEEALE